MGLHQDWVLWTKRGGVSRGARRDEGRATEDAHGHPGLGDEAQQTLGA